MISKQDPDTLEHPERMNHSTAMIALTHASNQCALIEQEMARLMKLKRKWKLRESRLNAKIKTLKDE